MYRIVNEETIQKRIEELEQLRENSETREEWHDNNGRIIEAQDILSNSIPLIPEIEKAFNEAREYRMKNVFKHDIVKDYISQLKLDI